MKFSASTTNLRLKITALLLSLVALWGFAAWVTTLDGLNLLWVNTLNSRVYEPSEPMMLRLQEERRLTAVLLGDRRAGQQRAALDSARKRTDEAVAAFRESAQNWQVSLSGSADLEQRITDLLSRLDELGAARQSIDDGSLDSREAARVFSGATEMIFRTYQSLGQLDDEEIADDVTGSTEILRSRELLSQEDALLAGVIAAGRLSDADRDQFAQIVGSRRFIAAEGAARLPAAERTQYNALISGPDFTRLQTLEDSATRVANGSRLSFNAATWQGATSATLAGLQDMALAAGGGVVERATGFAIVVIVRLVVVAVLGLLTVIAAIVVSVTTARALVAQLQRLRNAAHELSDQRLPGVVARLGRGEVVDVTAEAPPLDFGNDEIGQVGQAFNRVQETAIRTAVEQAELRRSVRDVFLSLARRTQALVHRQVTLLDQMERAEENPDTLEGLYRVDHLATRMRRNAENLIVLSGATPGRAWRRNVPMVDVVRGAMAEVEDYQRVTVLPFSPVGLAGRAVGDLIHLLAELIENALSFSPPNTGVEIKGQMVANGYVIEIEDRGLGMSPEDLSAANIQITTAQEFSLSNATRLGLYVVSRLTERHGVRVQLKESPYGGTTAVVLVPIDLVTDSAPAVDATDGALPMTRAAAAIGGATHADENRPSDGPQARGSVAVVDPPTPSAGAKSSGALPALPRRADRHRNGSDFPSASTDLPTTSIVSEPDFTVNSDRPPAPTAEPETSHTPSGLPFRVRQASLAPPLRDQGPDVSEVAAEDDVPRPPDQVRKMMSSYQSGTRRGRSDAARLLDEDGDSSASGAEDPPPHGNHPLT